MQESKNEDQSPDSGIIIISMITQKLKQIFKGHEQKPFKHCKNNFSATPEVYDTKLSKYFYFQLNISLTLYVYSRYG